MISPAIWRHCILCREGNVQGYKRVDGPSEDELKKKYEEGRKNSPFSNPSRRISHLSESLLTSWNARSTHLLTKNETVCG